MRPIEDIFSELNKQKKIVITMHLKPDGDAMGSSLALYHFLVKLGHNVQVISPTNWAKFLSRMPSVENVIDHENKTSISNQFIENADWIFCLDFNTLTRTQDMAAPILSSKAIKILIDHHQMPAVNEFSYGVSDTSKSSTAEMVYDFIVASGNENKIDSSIAECIYTGIMTDTGSFRFPSTNSSVHDAVSALMKTGFDHSKVHEDIYDNITENKLKFVGNALLNRLEIFYEYNTALIAVPANDIAKYDIKTGDTEGLVNYPLSIEGIKLAAIIIDRGEIVKCSFRSKGDFDVNIFARKYFNGGGHKNAAGGQSNKQFSVAVDDFISAMKENTGELSTYLV